MENYAVLVPLMIIIPFGGMLVNLFLGRFMSEKMIGAVASLAAGSAFTVAMIMSAAAIQSGFEPVIVNMPLFHQWISIPQAGLDIPWQFRVDTLSLTMMLVVTGVGTLIHIYAVGYMHGDSRFQRFFVFLNMFLGFMLILVTGNNFLMMFVGWEGVGLASFTLIGFWFDKKKGVGWRNSDAARKAFIVNRVGDFGLMTAIFLIFWTFGTLDYYKPGEVAVVHAEHGATTETHSEGSATEGGATGSEHQEATPGAEATPHGDAEATPAAEPTHTGGIVPARFVSRDPAAPLGSEGEGTEGPMGVFGLTEKYLAEGGRVVRFGTFEVPFETVILLITLFLLLGAAGKSAQIPLFVWLPDAMAGPTPVSALIHAATMVTAGIYLITRCNVLYAAAPFSAAVVTLVGAVTAVMAGFIAVGQWDIKRVLAYSTVSQLGFMIAAAGLGGYQAAMFHLVTHAFFKALLFLGSGSVIHAVEHGHHHVHEMKHGDDHAGGHHDEHTEAEEFDPQDMRNMGGLAQRMPVTYWTYLIGTLALAGIFPLSGFWSKDEILGKAWKAGFEKGQVEGYITLVLLIIAAGFTAFYMWRQIRLVFLGAPRSEAAAHAPENPAVMTVPLIILAVLSAFGGLLNLPIAFQFTGLPVDGLTLWLEQSVKNITPGVFYLLLAIIATAVAVFAMILADRLYAVKPVTAKGRDRLQVMPTTRNLFRLANAKLYWDEFYFATIVYPFQRTSKFLADRVDWQFWHDGFHHTVIRDGFNRVAQLLANPIDKGGVDAFFLKIGELVRWIGGRLGTIQTGYVRTYAFTMLLGVLVIILLILLPLLRGQ